MKVWRITRAPYQDLDGEGARVNGGRWNSEGNAVVYLASTPSLAILELLVHVDVEDVPSDLVLLEIDAPEPTSISEIDVTDLPTDWNVVDHPECKNRGDAWLKLGESLLLRVPSAISPKELNYLMNPAHPDAKKVTIRAAEPFSFDARLV